MMQRLITIALVLIITLYDSPRAFSTSTDNHPPQLQDSVPHIALLLPLLSPSFGKAAETVKQGFETATMRDPALPLTIRIYSTTDDPLDILATYHHALNTGAVLVVGPLTRDGVSALASSHVVEVPTLALNTADNDLMMPPNLYVFGLQLENEAIQLAEMARGINKNHAVIINDGSQLSIRLHNAFEERWRQSGASTESIQYTNEPAILKKFRKQTEGSDNVVFLALDAQKSRTLRSYLNPDTPVYATSQIFISDHDYLYNHDLDKVHFLDMPWLLQPDHPAVMAYQRKGDALSMGMERLYALGIDAFRITTQMLQASSAEEIKLDGVTGRIYFSPPNQFVREPLAAQFNNGQIILSNIP